MSFSFGGLGLLVIALPLILALIFDRIGQSRSDSYYSGYKWGYFLGLTMLLGALPFLYATFVIGRGDGLSVDAINEQMSDVENQLPVLEAYFSVLRAILVISAVSGLGIVLRSKWGWYLLFLAVFIGPLAYFVPAIILSDVGLSDFDGNSLVQAAGTVVGFALPSWLFGGVNLVYARGRWDEFRPIKD